MASVLALSALSLLGYHLTFDAEMTSPADMSQFTNTFQNGDTCLYNNNEAENYTGYDPANPANPFSFVNGALVISARPLYTGNQPYSSGLLETSRTFSQSGGYFEVRAATPSAKGFWPAFWLLPTAYYPEIDILEQPNNTGTTTEYWTHTTTPTDSSGGFSNTGVDLTHGYHRYGFLWTANSIQYVFDGQLVGWPHTVPPSMVGLQMYMIANLAVGGPGSWPGTPDAGATSSYSIDYIRAFSNDPSVPAVSQEPISSPDGVDTTPVLDQASLRQPASVGSGLDTLMLQVSEDAYQGDAQFTVSVDGVQRRGIFTARADHGSKQSQGFPIRGNFGTGKHTLTVNFLNDFSDGSGDRNLYVTGATLNGVTVHGAALTLLASGPQSFGFTGKAVQPITIGTGPDVFTLDVSNVPKPDGARFTVAVDGVPQGGVQVASALHAYGQTQTIAVAGTFGPAAHTVSLAFLNGAIGSTTKDPVDFYVDDVSYNGVAALQGASAMLTRGTYTLGTAPQQADTVSLSLTEDSWQGDAQAEISIDGKVMGTTTVTAPNDGSPAQTLNFTGNWGGAGVAHTVRVNYLNDAYAGAGQDRNLYVQSVTVNSVSLLTKPQALLRQGYADFHAAAVDGGTGWVKQAPATPPAATASGVAPAGGG